MTDINESYKTLITEAQLKKRIMELGKQISSDYDGKKIAAVGILKGGFLFMADLIREIKLPLETDFMTVSSYGNSTKSSGNVKVINDITLSVKGKDLLIIEDIIDTGATLSFLVDHLSCKNPASIKICSLLDKKSARNSEYDINIDYTGFDVPDKFLIGYGLDYQENYRNLPFIAELNSCD